MSWPNFTASASLGPTLRTYRARVHQPARVVALPQQFAEVDEDTLEEVTAEEFEDSNGLEDDIDETA